MKTREVILRDAYIKAIRQLDKWHEKTGPAMEAIEAYVDHLERRAATRTTLKVVDSEDRVARMLGLTIAPHVVLDDK